MPLKKMTLSDHLVFWGFKLFHAFLFIVLPIYMIGFTDWLIGFVIFTCVGRLCIESCIPVGTYR